MPNAVAAPAVRDIDPITKLPVNDARSAPLTAAHHGHECRHLDDMDWEIQRFPGIDSKMLFHPRPERPTEPNAGVLRYEPGGGHPLHSHYFAQVWYILEGEFDIGGTMYGPGTMVYHPDPHTEQPLTTKTGGKILFVQYQGPTTGQAPIYDGRFNLAAKPDLAKEPYDY
jgi:hypothetical protein